MRADEAKSPALICLLNISFSRKLRTFLSVLLHQNEEKQEAICTDVHDRACAIISVFQSIKASGDLVDLTKSKVAKQLVMGLLCV